MRRWFAIVSVVTIGAVSALASLPAGAGNGVPIEGNCLLRLPVTPVGDATMPLTQPFLRAECTEVEVTKVVTGDPAPGVTFDVIVACEAPPIDTIELANNIDPAVNGEVPEGLLGPFEETLTFGPEGGTETLLVGGGQNCTVSELPPPGCELVNINPEAFDIIFAPILHGAQVTPEPGSVLAVTVTNDCPAAAAAPAAVEVTPTFTG